MSIRRAVVAAGLAYVAATGLLHHYDAAIAHLLVALVEGASGLLASSLKVSDVSVDNVDHQTVFQLVGNTTNALLFENGAVAPGVKFQSTTLTANALHYTVLTISAMAGGYALYRRLRGLRVIIALILALLIGCLDVAIVLHGVVLDGANNLAVSMRAIHAAYLFLQEGGRQLIGMVFALVATALAAFSRHTNVARAGHVMIIHPIHTRRR